MLTDNNPVEILKLRLAKGELDINNFRRLKDIADEIVAAKAGSS